MKTNTKIWILGLALALGCGKKEKDKSRSPSTEEGGEEENPGENGKVIPSESLILEIPKDTIALGIEKTDTALYLSDDTSNVVAGPLVAVNVKGEMMLPLGKIKDYTDGTPQVVFTGVLGEDLIIALMFGLNIEGGSCSIFKVAVTGGKMECVDMEHFQLDITELKLIQQNEHGIFYHASNFQDYALKQIEPNSNVKTLRKTEGGNDLAQFIAMRNGSVLTVASEGYSVDGELLDGSYVKGVIGDTIYIDNSVDTLNGAIWHHEVKTYTNGVYGTFVWEDPRLVPGEFFEIGDKGYVVTGGTNLIKQVTPTQELAVSMDTQYYRFLALKGRVFADSGSKVAAINLATGASTSIAEGETTEMTPSPAEDKLMVIKGSQILMVDVETLEVTEVEAEKALASIKMIR